jgi:ribosomal protein S18 acetylase RimI-like enzyme
LESSERQLGLISEAEMHTEAVIRRVRDDELAAVLEMWDAAGVTPPSVSDSIEGLTRLIREPAALLLVATIDDAIVGSAIGGWDGWRGNIYRLAVTPEHRRKGIARRLVVEITRELFAKGATRLSALVEHEHQWAIDFWNSMSELGYDRDPKFARYIADRTND